MEILTAIKVIYSFYALFLLHAKEPTSFGEISVHTLQVVYIRTHFLFHIVILRVSWAEGWLKF